MKVALIGSTGFVGARVLDELLRRGHSVTAIVRDTAKLPLRAGLSVSKGDVLREDDMAALAKGQDAVVSAYNAGWKNPNIYSDYMSAVRSILAGTKKAGVRRFLAVGGAGSLETASGLQIVDTPDFPAAWKQGALAARDMLGLLRKEDGLDWTMISPAIFMEPGSRTGRYRVGTDRPVSNDKGESRISVEDLAVALVDELESPKYVSTRFTVGY